MNIFRKNFFFSKSFVKIELSYVFIQLKTAWKSELSDKDRCFSLVCNYLRPSNNSRQLIFNINAVVLIVIICYDLRKMVKCLHEFEYFFYCILEK